MKKKYCNLCESTKCDIGLHKRIEKSLQQCKEGRTYTMSCSHYKGKGFFVCDKCLFKDCERWYKLGKKDGAKCKRCDRKAKLCLSCYEHDYTEAIKNAIKLKKKSIFCKYCSLKCIASDCECKCHNPKVEVKE